MKNIVFCDIDGTLIDGFRGMFEVSMKTKEAVKKLKQNSYFILTSGRAKCMLNKSLMELDADGYILNSGAYIEIHGKELKNRCFSAHDIQMIEAYTKKAGNQYLLVNQKEIFSTDPHHSMVKELLANLGISEDKVTNQKGTLYNFMIEICHNEDACPAFLEAFSDVFNIRRQYQYTAFDINDPHDDKGSAVKTVMEYLQVNENNSYCFGDSDNDVEMMNVVRYAIAMQNARESIKKVASFVTDDVLNDGFYQGLVEMKLIK